MCLGRCACTFILGATVCMCYLYVNVFTLFFVHSNPHYFCGMLFISVFICGAFISPSHLSASGSPRLSVKDTAHRRIRHAIAHPSSYTGCFFVFFNSVARLFMLTEIRCAAGQTCWLGMKAHLMQGAQLFPWRACLSSDHS